jgi:UDP-N-acetylglucosamine 2-epimerase
LITAHRRENHGAGIQNICEAIKKVSGIFPDLLFTWPVHPNPNVKEIVYKELQGMENVNLTEPLGYIELVKEIEESFLIWSDSGGIQEEAPSFSKPVLILRNVTERPEVVTSGFGKLVGTDTNRIVALTCQLMTDEEEYERMTMGSNPFGDGHASERILDVILKKEKKPRNEGPDN